jgi:hypothetical protein
MIDLLNDAFQSHWLPGTEMSIDEDMISYLGRNRMIQYLPKKARKHGFRAWKLCDNSDFLLKLDIYPGENYVKPGFQKYDWGEDAVWSLIDGLNLRRREQGALRRLFTDNFFTTVRLARDLVKKNIYLTGTIRKNRIGLPRSWMEKDLVPNRYDSAWKMAPDGMLIQRWKETKEVSFLSTVYGPEMVPTERWHDGKKWRGLGPLVAQKYNENMGSTDRHNRARFAVSFHRKSLKWTHSVIMYLIECAVVNAWIIYNIKAQPKVTVHEFNMLLAESLLQIRREDLSSFLVKSTTPSHLLARTQKYRRCVGCENKVSRTWLICLGCDRPMHRKCWRNVHDKNR